MAADEEDVIFEGQQLHQYLSNIGFKEYDVIKRDTTPVEKKFNSMVLNVSSSTTWKWLSGNCWLNIYKDSSSFHEHFEAVLQSGLLFEEDIQLLRSIMPEAEECTTKPCRISPLVQGALVCSIGSLSWWCYSKWGTAILPLTALGTVVLLTLWDLKKAHQKRRRLLQQKTLLSILKELFFILRKSTKLVQENELVLRGFTLAKTGSAVSRLENSELKCMARRWQSLPGLRKGIAYATFVAMDTLKIGTQSLVAYCPLHGQLDNTSQYLAFLDREALGLPELDDIENEAELKLSLLKRLHHIFLLLQSEFLRRLALCFCPNLWKQQSGRQIEVVMENINQLIVICSELASNLAREYKVFYSYGVGEQVRIKSFIPIDEHKHWVYADTYTAVHSTGLHLQAMLFRTRAMEELLETRKDVESMVLIEDLRMKMFDILQELDICKSCCDEGLTQLSKLKNSIESADIPSQEDVVENVKDCTNVQLKSILVGYTDLDPKVEDEVFETIIRHDSATDTDNDYEFIKLTKEELLKQDMEKQFSKRMLQELKSVLVDKAQEWKEREAKAIENKQDDDDLTQKSSLGPGCLVMHLQFHL